MQRHFKLCLSMLGIIGLVASGQIFSQTTLFGSSGANNAASSSGTLSPDAFKQQVQQMNQQTRDKIKQEVAKILPQTSGGSKASAPQQPAPTQAAPRQTAPAPTRTQPSRPANDIYNGFGSGQPPKQQQPAPSSGGGWNINY